MAWGWTGDKPLSQPVMTYSLDTLICITRPRWVRPEHYHNKLSEADNHKDVYSIANSLLFGPKVQKLPTHDSVQDLSEQFYFIQKIVTIRNGLCQNINTDNQCDETDVIFILGSLKPATDEEISKIIRSSASKSCDLDHLAFEALFVWTATCHHIYCQPVSLHQYCTLWT